jgi:hypothetical protein
MKGSDFRFRCGILEQGQLAISNPAGEGEREGAGLGWAGLGVGPCCFGSAVLLIEGDGSDGRDGSDKRVASGQRP